MKRGKLLFSITKRDFDVQTFASGGPGGQHSNKTDSGVRIVHRESGAVGESRSDRSQHRNKANALKRLVASPKFQMWHRRKVAELSASESIEEKVNKMMAPHNLLIEEYDGQQWKPIDSDK